LTMAGTIAPALMAVRGVNSVHADGARISEEASQRMRRYLGDEWLPPLPSVEPPMDPALSSCW
jgi:hypothetical protein